MKNTQLMEYAVPQGVRATKTALLIPNGMSGEEWAALGQYLKTARESLAIWNADWLKYGRANYDADFVDKTLVQMELDLKFRERLELIGEVVPAHRHESLNEEHYLVVGKRCTDDKEREVWLNTAAIEGLSPRELQASIRAKEVIRIEMEKRKVSLPSPYAARAEYRAWRKELGDAWLDWSAQDCLDVAETLQEQAEFYATLTTRAKALQTGNA